MPSILNFNPKKENFDSIETLKNHGFIMCRNIEGEGTWRLFP